MFRISLPFLVLPLLVLLMGASNPRSSGGTPLGSEVSSRSTEQGAVDVASPGMLVSEEEAHRRVWALPEVQQTAEYTRDRGVRVFTMTGAEPVPGAGRGTEEAGYTIYLAEDHQTHTVRLQSFVVDGWTGEVGVPQDLPEGL